MARGVRFDELVVCVPGQVQYFLGTGFLVAPGAAGDVAVDVVFKVQVLVEAQAVVAHHAQGGFHGLAVFAGDGVQQVAGGVEGKQFAGQRAALCGQAGEDAARGVVYTDVLWNFQIIEIDCLSIGLRISSYAKGCHSVTFFAVAPQKYIDGVFIIRIFGKVKYV